MKWFAPRDEHKLRGQDQVARETEMPLAEIFSRLNGSESAFGRQGRVLLSAFIDTVEPAVARLTGNRTWVVVQPPSGELELFERSGRRLASLGAVNAMSEKQRNSVAAKRHRPVEFRLSADRLVCSDFKVPQGAMAYAGQIVEHRLERLTPWKPEKIVYGFKVSTKAGPDGQHDVRVSATSRDIAAAAFQQLDQLRLTASVLGSADEPLDRPVSLDLLRGKSNVAASRRRRFIGAAALAMTMASIVAFAASTMFLWSSGDRLADVAVQLSATRAQMAQGMPGSSERTEALALLKAKQPDTALFVLLNRLAAAIPQNAFLEELEIEPARIHLAGSSADAYALIGLLESKLALSEAIFASPVTRQSDGRDSFDITATRQPATSGDGG